MASRKQESGIRCTLVIGSMRIDADLARDDGAIDIIAQLIGMVNDRVRRAKSNDLKRDESRRKKEGEDD